MSAHKKTTLPDSGPGAAVLPGQDTIAVWPGRWRAPAWISLQRVVPQPAARQRLGLNGGAGSGGEPGCRGVAGCPGGERVAAVNGELARRILVFGALLGWCAILLVFRMHQAASFAFAFLEWNLFLAVIPAVAAWRFAQAAEGRSPAAIQAFWFAVWLVFLPNAPYIMTDLVHLGPSAAVPLWYDLVLLASCAGTGLLLGYTSLADVQTAITGKFSARAGWAVAVMVLLLSGFGIYLGRFLRLNSWDAVTRPLHLIADIAHLFGHPVSSLQVAGVTVIYGIGLLLGYIAIRTTSSGCCRSRLGQGQ